MKIPGVSFGVGFIRLILLVWLLITTLVGKAIYDEDIKLSDLIKELDN